MTKNKALRIKNAIFALLVKAKPATGPESKPVSVAEAKQAPVEQSKGKSTICFDSFGRPLPVRPAVGNENHHISRIERLRVHSQKIVDWFSSTFGDN